MFDENDLANKSARSQLHSFDLYIIHLRQADFILAVQYYRSLAIFPQLITRHQTMHHIPCAFNSRSPLVTIQVSTCRLTYRQTDAQTARCTDRQTDKQHERVMTFVCWKSVIAVHVTTLSLCQVEISHCCSYGQRMWAKAIGRFSSVYKKM